MKLTATRLLTALAGGVLLSEAAVAHSGHTAHDGPPVVSLALFASSLLVLGTGLYLDRRDDVEPKYADAGVLLGVGGLLVALALFLF